MDATIQQGISAQEYWATYPETTQPMELIEGEISMSPAPTPIHQYISSQIFLNLAVSLKADDLGVLQYAPNDVMLDDFTIVQPDLFFVSKENPNCKMGESGWHGAPDLCIEILSPSSQKRDRVDKFALYAQHGVREYWLVDPDGRFIEVYTLVDGVFQRAGAYAEGENLTSGVLPALLIPLTEIFPPLSAP